MVYRSFSDPHSSTRRNSGSCPCSATAAWLSSSEWHGAEMPSPSSLVGPQWGNGSGHPPGMQSISLGNQGLFISFHIYEACHRLVNMNQKQTKYGLSLGYIWIPDVGNVEIHMADLTSPALLGILFAQASSNPKSCSGWFGAMSTSWSVAIRGLIEST